MSIIIPSTKIYGFLKLTSLQLHLLIFEFTCEIVWKPTTHILFERFSLRFRFWKSVAGTNMLVIISNYSYNNFTDIFARYLAQLLLQFLMRVLIL